MSTQYEWRTGRYCVYRNYIHLVFVTKYRRGVFTEDMLSDMKSVFSETCAQMDGELLEFGGEDDHVHLMISFPPKVALSNLVGKLKGKSSYVLRRKYWDQLKKKLWGDHLWSSSYCSVTCGRAPLEHVKKYIENQRTPPSEQAIRQSKQETGRTGDKSRVRTGLTPP